MTRRRFIAAVTLILLAAPLAAGAQQAAKIARIGYLGRNLANPRPASGGQFDSPEANTKGEERDGP